MPKLAVMLVLVVALISYFAEKLLLDEPRKKLTNTKIKWVYIISIVLLAIVALSALSYIDILDEAFMKWYWFVLVTLFLSYNGILEKIYLKDSKEYLVTLISLVGGIIFWGAFIY